MHTFPSNLTEKPFLCVMEVNLLLEYGLKNFFSFKEGAIVSFRFDGNTPEEITQGRECATIMGINGANAAGKTQLLKALDFIAWFGERSFDWKPDSAMPMEAFAQSKEPGEFYVEFKLGEVTYRHEFSATDRRVYREALYRTKGKRVLVFERIDNSIKTATKEFEALHSITFRDNVSVISTVHQHQLPVLQEVYDFFSKISTNVSYAGLYEKSPDYNFVAKLLRDAPKVHQFVEQFIHSCDTGVSRIEIRQRENEKGEPLFYPIFIHEIDGKEYPVTVHEESSGTKRLFETLPNYLFALWTGGVRVVDEFDVHLHPHILPKILDLFISKEHNPKGAQLIFTSHNHGIMNNLGRYRSCIAAKIDNESFAFRLDEVPGDLLRNDRPISPIYDQGRIGGVPRI